MAILNNCELWFLRANPARPNAKFDKKNPSWEVQIRTQSREQKALLESQGIKMKAVIPDEEGEKPYYKAMIRKRTIKSDGEAAGPVKVTNGSLEDIDPDTVGNGSIGNIRVFQYQYGEEDDRKTASILMAIQITHHVHYKAKPREDDFDMVETTEVHLAEEPQSDAPAVGQEDGAPWDGDTENDGPADAPPPAAPKPAPAPRAPAAAPKAAVPAPKPATPGAPKPPVPGAPRTNKPAAF